jgi:hypothetical protein
LIWILRGDLNHNMVCLECFFIIEGWADFAHSFMWYLWWDESCLQCTISFRSTFTRQLYHHNQLYTRLTTIFYAITSNWCISGFQYRWFITGWFYHSTDTVIPGFSSFWNDILLIPGHLCQLKIPSIWNTSCLLPVFSLVDSCHLLY